MLQLGQAMLAGLKSCIYHLFLNLRGRLHSLGVRDVGLLKNFLESAVVVIEALYFGQKMGLALCQLRDFSVEAREFIEYSFFNAFVDVAI